jgi:hypothetical protein
MNTCKKCGCDDAYPSLPPCPTPVDCPNPQPCAEFFDAQCVRYTLPDIMCGLNIVVAQDSSIAEALESIVLFFCTNFSNSVQSVTGLNTDNTDPLNPIVKISVDGITITGLGTPASPLIAVGGGTVDGSGTLNYLARWTPDGNTLGNSLMRDNGTTTSINGSLSPAFKFIVYSSLPAENYAISGNTTNNGAVGINGVSSGVGTGTNYGVSGSAQQSTLLNIGVYGLANGPGAVGVGGYFRSTLHTDNYSVKLQDGTEGVGKVLTCMTATGEANCAILGTGLIRDNNTSVGIGGFTVAIYRVNIETSTQLYGLVVKNTHSSALNTNYIGINGSAEGINTVGQNAGVVGSATGNSNVNIGVSGSATSAAGDNIGIFAQALNGTSNHAIKLNDGTNALGRVLTCVGIAGEGSWGKVTSTYTTGASGSFVVGAQTITVTNGLITSIV